ncbi:unnamed protein product [Urochloa humidicola]
MIVLHCQFARDARYSNMCNKSDCLPHEKPACVRVTRLDKGCITLCVAFLKNMAKKAPNDLPGIGGRQVS